MSLRRLRSSVVVTALVAVLVLVVTACGGSDGSGGSGKSDGKDGGSTGSAVYEAGDSITAKAGTTFVVELAATPSTGYEWTAVSNAQVTFVSSEQVTGSSTLAGAPGTQRLTFRATAAGSSTLTLNYARSFDPAGTAPAKTETFPVKVTGTAKGAAAASTTYRDGQSITAAVGDTFAIELAATPSTGYEWTAVSNAQVTFVSSEQVTGSSTLAGAPGTQRLTFRATAAGSSTLTLNYARSFDPAGTPPAKTATFPVTVK